jgi:DNA-binding transcriptional LysR family regulator
MDWDRLKVFYAVAQSGSFTKAGDKLGLSQSAISRQVSKLEDGLSISLFHRHARGLILTEQGDILYQTVKDIFTKLATAENAITESKDRPKGPLRVTATSSLCAAWLSPMMPEFVDMYPEIQVTLLMEEGELDLAMREADVAIRMFQPKQPDVVHRHLMKFENGVYASTDYLKRNGVPSKIDDLDSHKIIGFAEGQRTPYDNVNWLVNAGAKPGLERKPSMKVNNLITLGQACEAGLGIAGLPGYMVQHSPKLTRILDELKGPPVDVYLVYPAELRHSKRLRVFRDFMVRKAQEHSKQADTKLATAV